jgi:general secretion pathway protein I
MTSNRGGFRNSAYMRGGFTLLEVLVALVIFALTAIVLGSAYVNILNGYAVAARGNEANQDVAFARGLMLAEPDRKVIEQGGDFETVNNRRVRWNATIESTTINDLFTVTFICEISAEGNSEPEKITQTFTVLRPTWSDPVERGTLLQNATARITEMQGKKPL